MDINLIVNSVMWQFHLYRYECYSNSIYCGFIYIDINVTISSVMLTINFMWM